MTAPLITLLFVGFSCSLLIRFFLLLDINKRVYNHTPGPCRFIRTSTGIIANGSAGMTFIRELNIALITTGYARNRGISNITSAILLYNFIDNKNYEVKKLKIKGFNLKYFIPYGIDTYVSRGRVTVYITNSYQDNDTVEVFQLNYERLILIHRKTISNDKFRNLADIAVVGADRFIVTNYVYCRKNWMQIVEFAVQSSFGSIVYYDGQQEIIYFPTPNGIAINKKQNRLYVASTINEFIRIYHLRQDMSVIFVTEISLLSSPNKLFIESNTGNIWVALHPVLYKTYKHMQNPINIDQRSPSQILRIRLQENDTSWVITEPYANDGATISGSSAVLFYKNSLLIGSLFNRMLHCDIDTSQIV
ncbi:Mechanosensory abnormality protein 6 [Dirofilaria immitis]|nr:Mechanosensory abnormality protein 6 [Dirofilaria immitis]